MNNRENDITPRKDLAGMKEMLQKRSGDKPWQCSKCGQMLGVVSEDKETVRIKYKDLFIFIEGGSITTLCRKCGFPNSLSQLEVAEEETPATEEKVEEEKPTA